MRLDEQMKLKIHFLQFNQFTKSIFTNFKEKKMQVLVFPQCVNICEQKSQDDQ